MAPTRKTDILALPDEILEKIALLLDEASIYALADSDPRLQNVCLRLVPIKNIKTIHVHHVLRNFVTARASDVQVLDLSNCWTGSKSMRAVIRECYNLSELNVVNSSLTVDHLLEVLWKLDNLKQLSATVVGSLETSVPLNYPSIDRIYLEFAASFADARLVIKFLKSCPNAKHLYLMAIGKVKNELPMLHVDCGEEELAKYDTIIIHGDLRRGWSCDAIFYLIFKRLASYYTLDPRSVFLQSMLLYERGNYAVRMFGQQMPMRIRRTITRMYHSLSYEELLRIPDYFRNHKILGLRTLFPYLRSGIEIQPLDVLSTVVEIDFSQSHLLYPARSWQSLVDSSPAVEALALPSCSMLRNAREFEPLMMNEEVLSALTRLKIKKLCIKSSGLDTCPKCFFVKLSGELMIYMGEFDKLETLTVDGARLCDNFFDFVEKPLSIHTLKLRVLSISDDIDFAPFLRSCPKLRNLKLEACDLPISSDLLWHALSCAKLKQLCLYSTSPLPVELSMLRINLFWLFKTLDIFHLHAKNIPKFKDVDLLIEEEALIANLTRRFNPVYFITTQRSPALENEAHDQRFVGRSLCCMDNFIGIPNPVGWDCHS